MKSDPNPGQSRAAGNRLDHETSEILSRDEERDLAAAVVRGDGEALERFHALYSQPLYRFVFYRLEGRIPDVEEIVQETFLAALQSLHRFRGRSTLFTWMCGIAKNHISKFRRSRSRERIAGALEAVENEIAEIVTQLEQEELPDSVLEREETEDLVGATMASLPVRYQAVLHDKYIESLPVNEIARLRNSTPKAVESTLSRARSAFRRTFELLARGMGGQTRHA